MGLELNFKGSILNLPHVQAGKDWNATCFKFENFGVILNLGHGEITLDGFTTGGIQDLLNYQVSNTGLLEYIESFSFECVLPLGIERQVGRYKLGTASGRLTLDERGKYRLYLGAQKLDDLKTLVLKIEDGEIWPVKIPQKEHIPAFKFYRKTYGVPFLLCITAFLLTWVTYAMMHEGTYLFNKQIHDYGALAMVKSMWGIVVACLVGSRWVYLFSKDIKPVERMILGVIACIGLLWFVGCFYYMTFA